MGILRVWYCAQIRRETLFWRARSKMGEGDLKGAKKHICTLLYVKRSLVTFSLFIFTSLDLFSQISWHSLILNILYVHILYLSLVSAFMWLFGYYICICICTMYIFYCWVEWCLVFWQYPFISQPFLQWMACDFAHTIIVKGPVSTYKFRRKTKASFHFIIKQVTEG